METYKIIKVKENTIEYIEDYIIEEITLTIMVNDKELISLLSSPNDIEDLLRGHLFTSNLINKIDDIKEIIIDKNKWIANIYLRENIIIESNNSKIYIDLRVQNIFIYKLMEDFQNKSQAFLKTGGTHSAAIADNKGILIFKEDISRYNTIDKIIGNSLSKNINFTNKILLTSGRISSKIFLKIQKCNIPIIISRSAPTNQTIKLAKDMNITLIGFARGKSLNIYTCAERILI